MFRQSLTLVLLTTLAWVMAECTLVAADRRCVALDLYVDGRTERSAGVERAVREFIDDRSGISVHVRDLDGPQGDAERKRIEAIAKHYRFDARQTPVIYGVGRVVTRTASSEELAAQLESLLRVDVYVRSGCSKCARAKPFIETLKVGYPGLEVRVRDLVTDWEARQDLEKLVRRHQQAAASVPVFDVCNQLIVGFDHESSTGRRIETTLQRWTYECRDLSNTNDLQPTGMTAMSRMGRADSVSGKSLLRTSLLTLSVPILFSASVDEVETGFAEDALDAPSPLPTPGELSDEPLLDEETPLSLPNDEATVDTINVPVLGRLSLSHLGLPLFTVAVGLVDGFNPCAMWVLLFLLSILVNLKSRLKILAVAGVFVLISGLAYFAFMAAWLNVFQLIGLLRPVQIGLALIAIGVGTIHVKDYFAFKQGISLSIPESAKPGIYARVRRIVNAENLLAAVIGASVLAVMVNIIELLCTAGLPAMYTEILTMQQLPIWKNYAYLGLYNVAYMFDDGLMVAAVVVTLGHHKMQEQHGRVLKLISGTVILLLGLVMLVKPEWLL